MQNGIVIGIHKFEPRSIYLNSWERFKIYLVGVTSRTNILKSFCLENGIEYPPKTDRKYHFTREYIVKHHEIKNLGKIRDQIILSYYEKYAAKQKEIVAIDKKYKDRLQAEQKYLNTENKDLEKLRKQRSVEKDPLAKIWLDDQINSQKAKIKNIESEIDLCVTAREELKQVLQDNVVAWSAQVNIIEAEIDARSNAFVDTVTRKIQNKLNYTKFKYVPATYSDGVKKVIKGAYHE